MERNNGKGIFYGVIGVATLVVAIIGATFAYFTASASNNNVIKGNMATVQLSLAVEQVELVADSKGGMIPMSNGMVEKAVNNTKNEVCVDDNGNAVCQVYKITITNDSSAGQFVDGYVALRGGSGVAPTDLPSKGAGTDGEAYTEDDTYYTYTNNSRVDAGVPSAGTAGTTMRWAQVFVSGDGYTTAGTVTLGDTNETVTLASIDNIE